MQRRDQGLKKRKGVPLQDPQNMALLVGGMGDEELLVPGEEEEEQAPPEEESTAAATSADASPPPPQLPLLTATCGMAVTSLRCSRDAVVQQIDAITGAGLRALDEVRADFVERMRGARMQVLTTVNRATAELADHSARTQELWARADKASSLIEALRNKSLVASHPQERPRQLFTADEEVEEGSGEEEAMGDLV